MSAVAAENESSLSLLVRGRTLQPLHHQQSIRRSAHKWSVDWSDFNNNLQNTELELRWTQEILIFKIYLEINFMLFNPIVDNNTKQSVEYLHLILSNSFKT